MVGEAGLATSERSFWTLGASFTLRVKHAGYRDRVTSLLQIAKGPPVLDVLAGLSGCLQGQVPGGVDDERQRGVLPAEVVRNGARGVGERSVLRLEALRL